MRRADRLFRIVQILRNRRFATSEQLSTLLEVSQRTIYRDVKDIIGAGVPIRGEAGVGYSLERNAVLPPLTFNSEEVEALVLGARMAVAWADPALAGAARSVIEKVEAMVPEPLRDVVLRTALFAPGGDWTRQRSAGLDLLRAATSAQAAPGATLRDLAAAGGGPWPAILRDHHDVLTRLVEEIDVVAHRNARAAQEACSRT